MRSEANTHGIVKVNSNPECVFRKLPSGTTASVRHLSRPDQRRHGARIRKTPPRRCKTYRIPQTAQRVDNNCDCRSTGVQRVLHSEGTGSEAHRIFYKHRRSGSIFSDVDQINTQNNFTPSPMRALRALRLTVPLNVSASKQGCIRQGYRLHSH